MTSQVRHNPARSRFELDVEGDVAIATYRIRDGVMSIFHTEVPTELRERGIGSRLVQGVLEQAREQGLRVAPLCPFVRNYIDRRPEFRSLLA